MISFSPVQLCTDPSVGKQPWQASFVSRQASQKPHLAHCVSHPYPYVAATTHCAKPGNSDAAACLALQLMSVEHDPALEDGLLLPVVIIPLHLSCAVCLEEEGSQKRLELPANR
jgi:hypothetical protein